MNPNTLYIRDYQVDFSEIVSQFSQYDHMYFFCKGIRTAINISTDIMFKRLTSYDPITSSHSLINDLVDLMEIYQFYSEENTQLLTDYNFLNQLEEISNLLEHRVVQLLQEKLPMNKQIEISNKRWLDSNLTFNLTIYD